MRIIEISGSTCVGNVLDKIEERIGEEIVFVILRFNKEIDDTKRKEIIHTIKKYYDIFIILKTDVPEYKKRLEEYLAYGIHGILFSEASGKYTESQIEIISYAVEIFPDNLIFTTVDNDKCLIEILLDKKIIPIAPCWNKDLMGFIKRHSKFSTISNKIFKYIPMFDAKKSKYTILDKIKIKMILESINLRQKLMVKSVEDSFNSSSL